MSGLTDIEAADQVGVDRTTIWRWKKKGRIRAHPNGLIDPESLMGLRPLRERKKDVEHAYLVTVVHGARGNSQAGHRKSVREGDRIRCVALARGTRFLAEQLPMDDPLRAFLLRVAI